jgi:hypothetical protein
MRKITFTLAASIAALALSVPAEAAQFLVTYTGTAIVNDNSNYFGLASFLGRRFGYRAAYTLTLPTPGSQTRTDGSRFVINEGGTTIARTVGHPTPSPLSAILTINGVNLSFNGSRLASALRYNNNFGNDTLRYEIQDEYFVGINRVNTNMTSIVESGLRNFIDSLDYSHLVNYTVLPGDFSLGSYGIGVLIPGVRTTSSSGTLIAERVSVSAIGNAIPEPAAWALMLAGFALTGSAIRRRRVSTPVRA